MKNLLISLLVLSGVSCATVNQRLPVNSKVVFCRDGAGGNFLFNVNDVTMDEYSLVNGQPMGSVISHCANGKCDGYVPQMCNVIVKSSEKAVELPKE